MITNNQKRALTFIQRHITSNGLAPTCQEIADELGLASKSYVHRIITSLVERHCLVRLDNRARAIALTDYGLELINEYSATGLLQEIANVPGVLDALPGKLAAQVIERCEVVV